MLESYTKVSEPSLITALGNRQFKYIRISVTVRSKSNQTDCHYTDMVSRASHISATAFGIATLSVGMRLDMRLAVISLVLAPFSAERKCRALGLHNWCRCGCTNL